MTEEQFRTLVIRCLRDIHSDLAWTKARLSTKTRDRFLELEHLHEADEEKKS